MGHSELGRDHLPSGNSRTSEGTSLVPVLRVKPRRFSETTVTGWSRHYGDNRHPGNPRREFRSGFWSSALAQVPMSFRGRKVKTGPLAFWRSWVLEGLPTGRGTQAQAEGHLQTVLLHKPLVGQELFRRAIRVEAAPVQEQHSGAKLQD
jgi:hypothetical protein